MTVRRKQRAVSSKRTRAKRISRIFFLVCLLPTAFLPAGSVAQQLTKIPRIGYLGGSTVSNSIRVDAFRQGLRELGYVEGKNIVIEWRPVEGKQDRERAFATEL